MTDMADAPNHADVKEMNFEQALKLLEDIVDKLERGDVPLDESIAIEIESRRRLGCE